MSSGDNAKDRDPKRIERVTDLADVVLTPEEEERLGPDFVREVVEEAGREVDCMEAEAGRSK